MTRGKWVALAVGLAAIAVLVFNGPAVWRAVAYVEEERRGFFGIDTRKPFFPDYVVLTRGRFGWGHEPDFKVRCSFCIESAHLKCPREIDVLLPPFDLDCERVHCTCSCPHPSHAQESE